MTVIRIHLFDICIINYNPYLSLVPCEMMWMRISGSLEKSHTELTLLSCVQFCLHAAKGAIKKDP